MAEFTCTHRSERTGGEWCDACYRAYNGKGRMIYWCMRHDKQAYKVGTGELYCLDRWQHGQPCDAYEALLTVWVREVVSG